MFAFTETLLNPDPVERPSTKQVLQQVAKLRGSMFPQRERRERQREERDRDREKEGEREREPKERRERSRVQHVMKRAISVLRLLFSAHWSAEEAARTKDPLTAVSRSRSVVLFSFF